MNKVVKILMERDGMSEDEAIELVEETREETLACEGSEEAWDIIEDNLGLEPDYIFDILDI
jgi:hypothetical protein